jgi:tryptophan-rich sensory protein
MQTDRLSSFWKLVIAIVACEGVGILSAFLSQITNNAWFSDLVKPSWNPPAYLFGSVWTLLYLLMSIALWIIWKSDTQQPKRNIATSTFIIQLFLNFWWSILFFRFHAPLLALLDIIALLIAIVIMINHFAKISKLAAWLLIPYLLWVSFATVLNLTIWLLNP